MLHPGTGWHRATPSPTAKPPLGCPLCCTTPRCWERLSFLLPQPKRSCESLGSPHGGNPRQQLLLQGSGTRTASLDGEDHARRPGGLTVKFGAGGIAAELALGPHSPGTDKSTGRGPCYRKRVVLSLGLAWLVSALWEELCITQRAAATAALVARCHLIGVARSRLPRPPEHP